MKKIPSLMVFTGVLFSMQTQASSDDSWQKLFSEVNKACVAAAGITHAQISKPVLFPDEAGMVGLVLKGKTAKVKNALSLMCLYDKTKKDDVHQIGALAATITSA